MSSLDQLCVNTIRVVAADMVQKANSGHPGMPMGMAPIAHTLWSRIMNFAPSNTHWWNRDRFILSNGHGCCLQYVLLHLAGYKLTVDDLKLFRQLDSKTPGHPESFLTEGIEVTTGPLGQGIANGVGLALGQSHLAAQFNKSGFELFNNYTYVFAGDGCMQEGVASEAASLAGHWKLGKLIVFYDDNGVQIDGHTSLAFSEDVPARFRAYGWHTVTVEDGDNDLEGMENAIAAAKAVTDKPTLISIKTTIGFGSAKQGTEETHGAPLGSEDLKQVKLKFGFNPDESFIIPDDVYAVYKKAAQRGEELKSKWESLFAEYQRQYPTESAELQNRFDIKFPSDWKSKLPKYTAASKADATRNLSGQVLNAVASVIPSLMGGSADLTPSNKTDLKGSKDYSASSPEGRYIRFGVREHGMAAIGNGMAAYGALIPYTATFLNFIEYCFPAVRLSALSRIQQLFIMTHDSIGLGEDGPTHQPIEALAMCRATPNILVFRPADGNETVGSYIGAMEHIRGPSVFSLTRQNLPHLDKSSPESVAFGGYVVFESAAEGGKLDLVYVASGSEVSLAIDAAKVQPNLKIRVVSMPCDALFDRQPVAYRRATIPPGVPSISLECLTTYGWQKYSHGHIGMTTFGSSGPFNAVMKHFGFTTPQVVERTAQFVEEFKEVTVSTGVPLGLLPTHHAYNDVKEFHH